MLEERRREKVESENDSELEEWQAASVDPT